MQDYIFKSYEKKNRLKLKVRFALKREKKRKLLQK